MIDMFHQNDELEDGLTKPLTNTHLLSLSSIQTLMLLNSTSPLRGISRKTINQAYAYKPVQSPLGTATSHQFQKHLFLLILFKRTLGSSIIL